MAIRIVTGNEDLPGEPIKLLEVNAATVETGSVEPFAFGATEALPYATIIAEVTPGEFERIERGSCRCRGVVPRRRPRLERPRAA